jgi:hypothetical protein
MKGGRFLSPKGTKHVTSLSPANLLQEGQKPALNGYAQLTAELRFLRFAGERKGYSGLNPFLGGTS